MTRKVNLQNRPWTDEEDATLERLWRREQLGHREIAVRLERSPSAITGRVWRNGWASPRGRAAWGAKDDAQLEQLWKRDGLSYVQIGEAMGRTRNSVIGRVARKGWQTMGAIKESIPRAPVKRLRPSSPARPRQPPPGPGPLQSPNAKPWTQRQPGECPFPVLPAGADTWSCCNPTFGFPYCRGHHVVMVSANQPPPKIEPVRALRLWSAG
jgi:hypothetical protein